MRIIQQLNDNWQYCEEKKDNWQKAKVPGVIQLELQNEKKLPDPYIRLNEGEYYSYAEKNWNYRCMFIPEKTNMQAGQIRLVMQGLDTYATVILNGQILGQTQNMFIEHTFDVTEKLIQGENLLEVNFENPIERPKKLAESSYTEHHSTVDYYRSYIRKAQYSYGWDWGPRLPNTGIWRPIYLEYTETARIEDFHFTTLSLTGTNACVRVKADIASFVKDCFTAEIVLAYNGEKVMTVPAAVEQETIDAEFFIENALLWYPAGYGNQPLYEVELRLKLENDIIDSHTQLCGVRIIELLREPDDAGEGFRFSVNGLPIFAKGANWIPGESMLPRMTDEDYIRLLSNACEAGMNMLRIWGGGIYEEDVFYNICDRLGLMVWQDFMYSCAEYPDSHEWFVKEAKHEAETVVKKLRNHPCIALWCGNNEINWGYVDWWGKGDPDYYGNYLFKKVFPEICQKLDPGCPYWISSPYGGEHPNSMQKGDRHSWEVWNGGEIKEYLNDNGRFISEFGFQAMPCWKTILFYTAEEDRHINSSVNKLHNKNNNGMIKLQRYLVSDIGLPKDFRSFVYLTQFLQAEAIRKAVEHWRGLKPHTWGTLYWQLNDCWPVASWSCIDYFGRKKALYYYTKRFYESVMPVICWGNDSIDVKILNDRMQSTDTEISLKAYDLNGKLLGQHSKTVNIRSGENHKAFSLKPEALGILKEMKPHAVDGFCSVFSEMADISEYKTVLFAEIRYDDKLIQNYFIKKEFREMVLPRPDIRYDLKGCKLTLVSDKPAFSVHVETSCDVVADDDWFNMEPGREYTINFSNNPSDIEIFDLTQLRIDS